MVFSLHPALTNDCIPIGDLPVCRLLLMNNRHFPWLILVPRREALREIFDLTPEDYQTVMEEVRHTAKQFAVLTEADKINIAALGNQVPQLHIHIIARKESDAAWPHPVWNAGAKARPYDEDVATGFINSIKRLLQQHYKNVMFLP